MNESTAITWVPDWAYQEMVEGRSPNWVGHWSKPQNKTGLVPLYDMSAVMAAIDAAISADRARINNIMQTCTNAVVFEEWTDAESRRMSDYLRGLG